MKTLDLIEAAAFVHLHPHTLEAKARIGEVPGAKPGKCWVFIDVDLADWLRSQYRKNEGEECRSTNVGASIGASGKSAAKELGNLLARKIIRKHKSTTTAAVLKFGGRTSSESNA